MRQTSTRDFAVYWIKTGVRRPQDFLWYSLTPYTYLEPVDVLKGLWFNLKGFNTSSITTLTLEDKKLKAPASISWNEASLNISSWILLRFNFWKTFFSIFLKLQKWNDNFVTVWSDLTLSILQKIDSSIGSFGPRIKFWKARFSTLNKYFATFKILWASM